MQKEKWKNRFRRWFKLRFAILYSLVLWAALSQHPTADSIRQSIWFFLAGLGMRTWANGYAIKLDKLTTCGPYSYVRNPLYLGTFCILVGFLIMLRINWEESLFILFVVIGLIYSSTIKNEERMLEDKFGKAYFYYKKKVTALIPWKTPYKNGEKWPWSFTRYIKSQEYKLFIWVIILIIGFYFKGEFLIEKEKIEVGQIYLIIFAVLLALIDGIGEIFRKNKMFFLKNGAAR